MKHLQTYKQISEKKSHSPFESQLSAVIHGISISEKIYEMVYDGVF